jgi:hypothetical protein
MVLPQTGIGQESILYPYPGAVGQRELGSDASPQKALAQVNERNRDLSTALSRPGAVNEEFLILGVGFLGPEYVVVPKAKKPPAQKT